MKRLLNLINRKVRKGTMIIKDGWKEYEGLNEIGYYHKVINHRKHFVVPENRFVYTQNIENRWKHLKDYFNHRY